MVGVDKEFFFPGLDVMPLPTTPDKNRKVNKKRPLML